MYVPRWFPTHLKRLDLFKDVKGSVPEKKPFLIKSCFQGRWSKDFFMTSQQLFPRSTTLSPVFHGHGMPHPLF